MPRPTTPSLTERFLGLADGVSTEIEEMQASRLENLYLLTQSQELVRRKGTNPLAATLSPNRDHDMLRWVRILSVDYLVASHNGNVVDWLAATPGTVMTGGSSRFTAGIEANAALIERVLYIFNGTDQTVRFNGTDVRQAMVEQPASGATLSAVGIGVLNGTYSFRFAFENADGLAGQATEATSGINVSGVSGIVISNIPQPLAGGDCAGIEVYRTTNGGTTWYRVAVLTVGTTGYTDATTDDQIDTDLPIDLVRLRMPPVQYGVTYESRLAGIGCNTSDGDNHTLYLSNYGQPGLYSLVGYLDDVSDPSLGASIRLPDVGTGLVSFGNVLVVFTRSEAWRLVGDAAGTWNFAHWLDHGCVAHRTIRSYKSMLIWLGPDGVYAVEGAMGMVSINRISDDLYNTLLGISASDQAKAHAFVWNDRYYLCFPSSAYYYDMKYRTWGKLTAWPWRTSTVAQNTGASFPKLYASRYGSAQVWELETGLTDNGTPIPAAWASRDKDMGQFARQKRVHRIVAAFKTSTGTATINLYRGVGELIQTIQHDLSSTQRSGAGISIMEKHAVTAARDEYFRLEIVSSTTDELHILRGGVHYTLST